MPQSTSTIPHHAQNMETIGVDVGGTHIAAARVNHGGQITHRARSTALDSTSIEGTRDILDEWARVIGDVLEHVQSGVHIGIAMPGPFDYARGVSCLMHKYRSLIGINIGDSLRARLNLRFPEVDVGPIHFLNDATAFCIGETWVRGYDDSDIIGITLGTGLGSAFMRKGRVVEEKPPFFEMTCCGLKAEEWFSSSGIMRCYYELIEDESEVSNVRELADAARKGDSIAHRVFIELGSRLADFLLPHVMEHPHPLVIVGGSIANAWDLFGDYVVNGLRGIADVSCTKLFEDAALIGASRDASMVIEPTKHVWRETRQELLPLLLSDCSEAEYGLYPVHHCDDGDFGWSKLAALITQQDHVVMDGAPGVFWDTIRHHLGDHKVIWRDIRAAMLPNVSDIVQPFVGDDPLFGRKCDLMLSDLFDKRALDSMHDLQSQSPCVCYGSGASLCQWKNALLIYWDLPKNEEQYRSRAGAVCNLGCSTPLPPKIHYKRSYFVDWPLMRTHMATILPDIDVVVDGQRDVPTWTSGPALREKMHQLGKGVWRVRPWFEPGPWGGKWLANHIPLPKEVNYAWSFELIAPENGLVMACNDVLVEVSFDMLMAQESQSVVGQRAHSRFGLEFPIRFDYLDNVDGGHLSLQVHPSLTTIEQFGETFTQDESYYIVHAEQDASVFVGLKDGADVDEFKSKLEQSADTVDVDKYVTRLSSSTGDYFLIPHGTIHSSGRGNVVLEISATPYIFTFKVHDWGRVGLDGVPRPLNIDRAFADIAPRRSGHDLRVTPTCISDSDGCVIEVLPTSECMFYRVDRIRFKRPGEMISISCDDSCQVMTVVEGQGVVVTAGAVERVVHEFETFGISAAAGEFSLRSLGICVVVKACMK